METRKVTAFAPASVANVGPGFDFMGFALEGAGDRVTISFCEEGEGTSFQITGKYGKLIPDDPLKNTAGVAVNAYLKAYGAAATKLHMVLEKNLPLGSGMGSSASSAVAAVCALNELSGKPFTPEELIPFAMLGEEAACGTAHADNAAPSMLGGFVVIRSHDPLDIVRIKCPDDLFCAVVHPHIEVRTSDARRILRREIPLSDVTRQCANVAVFIAGLINKDYDLIGRSMHDLLAEPKRINLIPGFEGARNAALEAGAIGCGISGSGPSVFSLGRGEHSSKRIGESIQKAFAAMGLESDCFITKLNAPGASVI